MASVAAHTGAPHHMHYGAAKAGLVNLTRSLARELAPGIRVNCVAPGITLTPMGQDTVDSLAADYATINLLLQRYATPRRVAQTIAVVASPVAEYMTGAVVDVSSGRLPEMILRERVGGGCPCGRQDRPRSLFGRQDRPRPSSARA